jgi:hypothetical protein
MPSREIRSFGSPAREAIAHSPRDTTLPPQPAAARRATTAATSFALRLYWRTHGSGKAASVSRPAARSVSTSVR